MESIKTKINWQLYEQNKLTIDYQNVWAYITNEAITFKEDGAFNNVNLSKQIYERKNKDYSLKIDFQSRVFQMIIKEKNYQINVKLVNAEFGRQDNTITLKYQLDDEEKKIIIQIL